MYMHGPDDNQHAICIYCTCIYGPDDNQHTISITGRLYTMIITSVEDTCMYLSFHSHEIQAHWIMCA